MRPIAGGKVGQLAGGQAHQGQAHQGQAHQGQAHQGPASQSPVTELKVTAHLMTLEAGVFCIFQAPTGAPADRSGLPGVRLSLRPGHENAGAIEIRGFRDDGWIGEANDAALVRVNRTSQILVSIYQSSDQSRAPNLQVMRIAEPVAVTPDAAVHSGTNGSGTPSLTPEVAEVSAHVERRGDVLGLLGDWMGEPGSKRWIEGFALDPKQRMAADDLEYQAVLGRGWLSPWVPGGEFCGSRGMALPILGLRVRLRGAAAEKYSLTVSATFIDGAQVGPVQQDEAAEADSLAPLEAFRIDLVELSAPSGAGGKTPPETKPVRRGASSLPAKPSAAKPMRRGVKPVPAGKPKRR
jgi:hypothetical protein